MSKMWMIRAGRGSELIDQFRERKIVAIGWNEIGDLKQLKNREGILSAVQKHFPGYKPGKARITASHLYRFAEEIKSGDWVLSYDSSTRLYQLGKITGTYVFQPVLEYKHTRQVEWESVVPRDKLSLKTKHALGSIATLFAVSEAATDEVIAVSQGRSLEMEPIEDTEEEADEHFLLEDIQLRSREFIKDKLNSLDWDEMQEVVAGLLRAIGYKTKISPTGPDRGRDIIASPDGFGFEHPRIVVEVKHRDSTMGAQEIRSFLGGRHKDDKGLYVSTGGFTKDAMYEAERASIPVALMDLDGLVDGILEHYEKMDMEVRAMLPLVKVWWVA